MLKEILFFCLIISLIFLIGCQSNSKPSGLMMHVSGKVDGLRKGTLFLQKILDSTLVNVDSLVINGEPEFEFRTEIESPEIYYLYLTKDDGDTLNDRIMFFAEKGKITINTLLKTFESSAKVKGSENQELLQRLSKRVGLTAFSDGKKLTSNEGLFSDKERRHGMAAPIACYPLLEQSLRVRLP